jgi:hypothetical protein
VARRNENQHHHTSQTCAQTVCHWVGIHRQAAGTRRQKETAPPKGRGCEIFNNPIRIRLLRPVLWRCLF